MDTASADYKKLISELLKKQMVILGPDITFAKARNVVGITVDINGEVQSLTGDPKTIFNELTNQFVELSSLIVKKTMDSILEAKESASEVVKEEKPEEQSLQSATPTQEEAQKPAVQVPEPQASPVVSAPPQETEKPSESSVPSPTPATHEPQVSAEPSPQAVPSPDQKIDPLVQTVTMPEQSMQKAKSELKSFSEEELSKLNSAIEEMYNQPQNTTPQAAKPAPSTSAI